MINISNFIDNRPKKHNRTNKLNKHTDKRYKLYWSRSTASGSGCGIIRIKPKHAGQKLYIVVGNGGDNSNFSYGNIATPTNVGAASGVGTLPDYSSNLFISPQGDLSQVGTAFNSGKVGDGTKAVGYSTGGFDTNLWTNFQIISNATPVNGKWFAIYDSWNTPGSTRTVSTYDGTITGPGASGNNNAGQNNASFPAIGGYVKITAI